MARPKNTPEQTAFFLQKKKERMAAQDRRKPVECRTCENIYKVEKGGKRASAWCDTCRFISLSCETCHNTFSIHRRFYNFRGAKYCSKQCSPQISRFIIGVAKENHPNFRHGLAVKENRKEYAKIHRKQNPEKYRMYSMHRVALERNAEGTYSFEQWEELKNKFGNMCLCCKRTEPEIILSADHILPLSKGGSNDISNIQPLCRSCNYRKHAKFINYISQYYELRSI